MICFVKNGWSSKYKYKKEISIAQVNDRIKETVSISLKILAACNRAGDLLEISCI